MPTPKVVIVESIGERAAKAIQQGKMGKDGLRLVPARVLRPILVGLAEDLKKPVLELVNATRMVVGAAYIQGMIHVEDFDEVINALDEIAEDPE